MTNLVPQVKLNAETKKSGFKKKRFDVNQRFIHGMLLHLIQVHMRLEN
jgi:hypothetical protein